MNQNSRSIAKTYVENVFVLKELFRQYRVNCSEEARKVMDDFETYLLKFGNNENEVMIMLESASIQTLQELAEKVIQVKSDILRLIHAVDEGNVSVH